MSLTIKTLRLILCVGLVAGGLILWLSAGSGKVKAATVSTGLSESQIVSIADGYAASYGDSSPGSIEHVEAPRQAAVLAASGDVVSDNREVILIVERGSFVGAGVPRPSGAAAPQGSVLTLAIDAQTGELTDLGIQSNVPDLASLGPVTVDQ